MKLRHRVSAVVAGSFLIAVGSASAIADSWDGFYAGVSAGMGRSTSRWIPSGIQMFDIKSGSALGGVQAGYNWQSGKIVAGLEADYLKTAMRGSLTPCAGIANFTCGDRMTGMGSVRGRLGWAASPTVLAYFTGGLAVGSLGYTAAIPGFSASTSGTTKGVVAGFGTEFKLNTNWSVKGEFLHYRFNHTTSITGSSADTVKAGLNYRF